MTYSIRCTGHPLSDSRFIQGGITWDDIAEAEQMAVEQTEHHRSVGMNCTFEVRPLSDVPVFTSIDVEVAVENGMMLVEGVDYTYLDESAYS